VLPDQPDGGCLHKTDGPHSSRDQVILAAWDVIIPVPEGTGKALSTQEPIILGELGNHVSAWRANRLTTPLTACAEPQHSVSEPTIGHNQPTRYIQSVHS
jgi:hypothetical protein